jgi:hypothetical protein
MGFQELPEKFRSEAKRTSGAKAQFHGGTYGTAEAVPLTKPDLF